MKNSILKLHTFLFAKLATLTFDADGIYMERNGFASTGVRVFMDIVVTETDKYVAANHPDNGQYFNPHEKMMDYVHALLHKLFGVTFKYANDAAKRNADTMGILFDEEFAHTIDVETYDYTPQQQVECVKEMLAILAEPLFTNVELAQTIAFLATAFECLVNHNWTSQLLPHELSAYEALCRLGLDYTPGLPDDIAANLQTRLKEKGASLVAQELAFV